MANISLTNPPDFNELAGNIDKHGSQISKVSSSISPCESSEYVCNFLFFQLF